MKALCLMFAVSFGLAFASSSSAAPPAPAAPSICPPNQYDCCDGDAGTAPYCAQHGGTCGIISRCGVPV